MVGHAMIYKVIICLCHGSLTNKTKQNKAPFYVVTQPPPPFLPSIPVFIVYKFISCFFRQVRDSRGQFSPHPSIRTRRRMSWCNLSKASSQKWPFPRLEIDFAASVVLIPPGEEWYRLRENRFSRRRRKNNGEKAIPIGGIQAINFLKK